MTAGSAVSTLTVNVVCLMMLVLWSLLYVSVCRRTALLWSVHCPMHACNNMESCRSSDLVNVNPITMVIAHAILGLKVKGVVGQNGGTVSAITGKMIATQFWNLEIPRPQTVICWEHRVINQQWRVHGRHATICLYITFGLVAEQRKKLKIRWIA